MVRQRVNDVTYHAKRKTRYKADCILKEWKESRIIRTTRTVTERTSQKCYALRDSLNSLYERYAIRMSGNMESNGIMIGEMKHSKHLPNIIS
jgi:hypothetical protein